MLPEPLAARDRGAVRDAGGAAPGPHRPRPRPRPGNRPAHGPRAAPRPVERGDVPAGRPRAAALPAASPCRARPWSRRRARARACRSGSWARACTAPQLAALLGLPYAFASHFAPGRAAARARALPVERSGRRSSWSGRTRWWPRTRSSPTTTRRRAGCSRPCSSTSRTSSAAGAASCRRPIDDIESYWAAVRAGTDVGDAAAARTSAPRRPCARASTASIAETEPDELIAAAAIHDHAARLRSYELLARLGAEDATSSTTGLADSATDLIERSRTLGCATVPCLRESGHRAQSCVGVVPVGRRRACGCASKYASRRRRSVTCV